MATAQDRPPGRSQADPERSVLITGTSSGIGYECAKRAVAEGALVFGSVRDPRQGDRLRAELGPAFVPLVFDVRDDAAVAGAAAAVRARLAGRTLSGLVNNAGTGIAGPLLYQPLAEIREQLDTNLLGVLIVTKALLPQLGADRTLRGAPGRIVMMSSIGGKVGQPFATAYAASKHGLEGFSEALRRELALHGIAVAIVAPATVRTPIWDKVEAGRGDYADTEYADAHDAAVRTIVEQGRRHGLEPRAVAETVWQALTARHPKLRYAPAAHPVAEQGVPRALPRRLVDWAIERRLGLRPRAGSAPA